LRRKKLFGFWKDRGLKSTVQGVGSEDEVLLQDFSAQIGLAPPEQL